MHVSEVVFRFAIALSLTFAVLTLALLPFLESGSGPWVASLLTLAAAAVLFSIAATGLYRDWDPFRAIERD